MEGWLGIAFFVTIGVVTLILAAGIINLIRTDDQAQSRSNKLMRFRVAAQFVAVLILVALGYFSGAFN